MEESKYTVGDLITPTEARYCRIGSRCPHLGKPHVITNAMIVRDKTGFLSDGLRIVYQFMFECPTKKKREWTIDITGQTYCFDMSYYPNHFET